jgi:hypothetical protein
VTSLNQLCITLDNLVSYLVGYAFAGAPEGWRRTPGLGAVPGAVLPESPRWLAGHGRLPQARAVLHRLRGEPIDVAGALAVLRTRPAARGRRLRRSRTPCQYSHRLEDIRSRPERLSLCVPVSGEDDDHDQ